MQEGQVKVQPDVLRYLGQTALTAKRIVGDYAPQRILPKRFSLYAVRDVEIRFAAQFQKNLQEPAGASRGYQPAGKPATEELRANTFGQITPKLYEYYFTS
jgi:hypothetical protein